MIRYWKRVSVMPEGDRLMVTTTYRRSDATLGPEWTAADDEVQCIDGYWYFGPKSPPSTGTNEEKT